MLPFTAEELEYIAKIDIEVNFVTCRNQMHSCTCMSQAVPFRCRCEWLGLAGNLALVPGTFSGVLRLSCGPCVMNAMQSAPAWHPAT